ncbi:hypothetical protein [Mesobacillus harenae]|uniref:hypothetical protein n=1 Tax=Mesobacillus harenae TaxID=2213203 RepID=UPI001580176D|nr:hypothetical protein [Mesobacillus harenae]
MMLEYIKKYKWLIFCGVLLFLISPIIVNVIVTLKPPFGMAVAENNDWIGFFGSFSGALVTLVGLIATILYTHYQYRDQDRKRIQPYFRITQFKSEEILKLDKDKYKLGIEAGFAEIKERPKDLYLKEIEFHGEVKNIGLGNAVEIGIKDLKLENRILKTNDLQVLSTYALEVLEIGEKFYFEISLFGLVLEESYFTTDFSKASADFEQQKISHLPKITFSFIFTFQDLLGNKYNQQVTSTIQIDYLFEQHYGPYYKSVDPPKLII